MTSVKQTNQILIEFNETRSRTLQLIKTLEKDDFIVQTAPFMSPPKWHLGHVSWLFEMLLDKKTENYEFYSKDYMKYLNSYYNKFGEQYDKDKRGLVSRPTVDEIFQYYNIISNKVNEFLSKPVNDETAELFTMAIHHECQHQELLVYDLQHLLAEAYLPVEKNQLTKPSSVEQKMISIEGGLYSMGYSGDNWCYDIELPEHKIYLNDYKIDAFPVTNADYLKFIEDGGYQDYKFWLSDGWDVVKKNNWQGPMYWIKKNRQWMIHDFIGRRKINPKEPVCNVSFYEADAYCKWAGKRLPNEAEWEKAACFNEDKYQKTIFPWGNEKPDINRANLLESYLWSPAEIGSYPDGTSPSGCHQMIGDVWEWTSSEFVGYPGFKPAFSEYNDKWFTNQKVLRGGSFGTPQISIRGSYRNFFRLDERWMFAGFRCVEDF